MEEVSIDPSAFKRKVEKLNNLPTLPHLMVKFTKMIQDPSTSMAAFGDEISKDQTLTTKLLRLVNSAFYGFPGRISTVTQALVLLGVDAVKGLIVTSSVFDGLTPEAFPLWRHSMLVSLCCRLVGNRLEISDLEEVTVAGLLHDIGKVILFLEAPKEYRWVLHQAVLEKEQIHIMERKILGFDHAEIGDWICEKWTLPEKLRFPIAHHHSLESAKDCQERTAIVALSDSLVKAIGAGAENKIPLDDLPPILSQYISLDDEFLENLCERLLSEKEALLGLTPKDLK